MQVIQSWSSKLEAKWSCLFECKHFIQSQPVMKVSCCTSALNMWLRLPLFYSKNNQATIIYWIGCSVHLQFKTTCKLNARHCHSWDLVWKWQDKAHWFQCWYYGWLLPHTIPTMACQGIINFSASNSTLMDLFWNEKGLLSARQARLDRQCKQVHKIEQFEGRQSRLDRECKSIYKPKTQSM